MIWTMVMIVLVKGYCNTLLYDSCDLISTCFVPRFNSVTIYIVPLQTRSHLAATAFDGW